MPTGHGRIAPEPKEHGRTPGGVPAAGSVPLEDPASGATTLPLTVIVVVGPLRRRVEPGLRALFAQGVGGAMEVLLVDLAPDGGAIAGAEHPAVRLVPLPSNTTFAAARAHAVRLARGETVAFVEEHARVRPGWARAVIAAHRGPWAGVAGEIHNANPGVGRSDVTSLLSYGHFRAPLQAHEAEMLSGHNSSYKRAVLLSYGDRLDRLLDADLVLMRRLRLDGHRLWIEPAAAIEHLNETTLASATRGYGLYTRCYAALRAEEFGWTLARRLAYVTLTPVIPLYFIAHFGRFLARRHRDQLGLFVRNLGFVYLAELAGAVGQAAGLLFGTGDAAGRFTRYELTETRPESTEAKPG